jgi:hypothetical protein
MQQLGMNIMEARFKKLTQVIVKSVLNETYFVYQVVAERDSRRLLNTNKIISANIMDMFKQIK